MPPGSWPPRVDLSAVTGIDAAGRKQYRYHDAWRTARDEKKFDHALEVAARLGVAAEDCLFVGDNVKNDIEGALDAGMQAAWIDIHHPAEHPCYDRPVPTAARTVHSLHELLSLPELADHS